MDATTLSTNTVGERTLTLTDEEWIIDLNGAPLYVEGDNELVFELPDARAPGNGDPRHLALRLKQMTFE